MLYWSLDKRECKLTWRECCARQVKVRGLQRVVTLSCLFASQRRYANNQHDLDSAIPEDPKETSFFQAMQLSEGVLIVPAAV